mgnify:CR=1 FL=1
MVSLEKMKLQVQVAEELEQLAIKAIETMDMEVLGEYGEMFSHHATWTLPRNFEKTENMMLASKLFLRHMEEAESAYLGR